MDDHDGEPGDTPGETEDWRPREHDHLVEPVFEALREHDGRRAWSALRWGTGCALWLLPLVAAGLALIVK